MLGLTMMLLTATLSPPSWLAMLPQKFSAAMTWSLPAPVPAVDVLDPPHPASRQSPASSGASGQNGDRAVAIRLAGLGSRGRERLRMRAQT